MQRQTYFVCIGWRQHNWQIYWQHFVSSPGHCVTHLN